MTVVVEIVVVRCSLVICLRLVVPTGALLAQVRGSFGCRCVMCGLESIQVRLQGILVHVRSIVQGYPFWRVLLVGMRHLETCRLMVCKLRGNS